MEFWNGHEQDARAIGGINIKTTPTFSTLPLKVLGLYSNNKLFCHFDEGEIT
jgi:hypothetical protein